MLDLLNLPRPYRNYPTFLLDCITNADCIQEDNTFLKMQECIHTCYQAPVQSDIFDFFTTTTTKRTKPANTTQPCQMQPPACSTLIGKWKKSTLIDHMFNIVLNEQYDMKSHGYQ